MPAQKDLVIGVDSSTTACKAIAWDATGSAIAESRAVYEMTSPQPDWYEQNAEDWWRALCSVLRGISAQVGADRIAALCITNQRESFVPVDQKGQPLRPAVLWLDARSYAEVEALDRRVGLDFFHDLTGKGRSTNPSLSKIMWLQAHEPDLIRRTFKLVEPHAFLVYRLTGRWATSLACADPMGVVDMRRGIWATDLMEKLDIDPGQFVEIVPAGEIIGELTSAAAEMTGLKTGLPIVAGAGDGQCAGLGANITAPGRAYLNLGTAVVAGAHAENYVADRAFRTLCSAIAGAFVPESVLSTGTFTVSWFADQFGPDVRDLHLPVTAEEVLEVAASKLPPGSVGLMLVPYWNAAMSPYWDPKASGITIGWKPAHRREHFYRAILEGIAYEQRLVMDGVCAAMGTPLQEYIVMGGGSRSDLWCQIIADVTGQRVTRASTTEATTLGAGILAAAAVGWYADVYQAAESMTATGHSFEPSAVAHAIYDQLYHDVYVKLFPALQPYLSRLRDLT
jgi:sugar (pentulose or hexulose) kinase